MATNAKFGGALKLLKKESVEFLRLQFTDLLGSIKDVEVPQSQFESALGGEVIFDGSSLQGFARGAESDLLLSPDLDTLRVFEETPERPKMSRVVCNIRNLDRTPFEVCPRSRLKKVLEEASEMGFQLMVAPEIEFFLFQRNPDDEPTTQTRDTGSYFDLAPLDQGDQARRGIIRTLSTLGIEAEAVHHEISPGQHEVDLPFSDAVQTADNIGTFRVIARRVALSHGLHATFMPKPIFGKEGSGMHLHLYLKQGEENAFAGSEGQTGLSQVGLYFVGGLLRHARGFTLVTNPLINSYKRLIAGFEAPTHSIWSEQNVNPLVRVPPGHTTSARCEVRSPDPACNPYLALAVILKAGLAGIKNQIDPGPPVNKDITRMSARERGRLSVDPLPIDLHEAARAFQKDKLLQEALGKGIYRHLLEAHNSLWTEYTKQVHPWELEKYLATY